jgi:hypothetical protein
MNTTGFSISAGPPVGTLQYGFGGNRGERVCFPGVNNHCLCQLMARLYGPAVRCKLDLTDLEVTDLAHLYSAL